MQIEDNYLDIETLLFVNQSLGRPLKRIQVKKYMNLYAEHSGSSA